MVKANSIKGVVASLSLAALLTGVSNMDNAANAGGPGYDVEQPSAALPYLQSLISGEPAPKMMDDKMMMDDMRSSKWDFFGHVDLSTNYVFRGRTQTDDKVAFSVELGTSYDFYNGRFYGKVWAGNVDIPEIRRNEFGQTCDAVPDPGGIVAACRAPHRGQSVLTGKNADYELDFTFGYAAEHDNLALHTVRYDIGVIAYTFPNAAPSQELDETHLFLTLGYENLSLSGIVLADSDSNADFGDKVYYSIDYDLPLPDGWGLEFHYGIEDIVDDRDLNQDFSVTVTKLGFHLGVLATTGFDGTVNTDDSVEGFYVDSDKQYFNNEADEDVRVVFGYTYHF